MTNSEPPDRLSGYPERRDPYAGQNHLAAEITLPPLPEGLAELVRMAFDAMPAHIAILDQEGKILAVNAAWRRFADANGSRGTSYGVGRKYLDAPESGHGELGDDGRAVARGIQEVLANQLEQFQMEYTCSTPGEQAWYEVRVNRLGGGGVARA